MLEDYIPEDAPEYYHGDHYGGVSANPTEYIESVVNPDVVTGSLSFASGSFYRKVNDPIERPAVLSARTIVDGINWKDLGNDHEYHWTAKHEGEDRPMIRAYTRARGILVHSLVLDDGVGFDEALRRVVTDIDRASAKMSYDDLYQTVAEWDGAPRVKPPEEEYVYETPRPALDQRIKDEAYTAVDNWKHIEDQLSLKEVDDEVVVLGETHDDHGYGCKLDRLASVEEASRLPAGLYVVDIKVGEEWHPAHFTQVEAYRRALFQDLASEPYGLVARIGPEKGDYDVHTSHDEKWKSAVLYELFERKARWMYDADKSRYPTALDFADPR
jgi:hypothetical protein